MMRKSTFIGYSLFIFCLVGYANASYFTNNDTSIAAPTPQMATSFNTCAEANTIDLNSCGVEFSVGSSNTLDGPVENCSGNFITSGIDAWAQVIVPSGEDGVIVIQYDNSGLNPVPDIAIVVYTDCNDLAGSSFGCTDNLTQVGGMNEEGIESWSLDFLAGETLSIRIINKTPDIPSNGILSVYIDKERTYVDADATGANDGTSWANAYTNLQDALSAEGLCREENEIWVAEGTYKPSAYPTGCTGCSSDRDFTFQLRDGISLYGGFAGNETQLSERDIVANPSILSGDIGAENVDTDNVYHVVLAAFSNDTPTTRLDGFTVTEGNANGGFTSITVNGAAVFRRNGGGITTRSGTNTLANNTLSENTASNYGGGIYTSGGTTTLTNNTLSENTADRGGGIFTIGGTITLTNNILSENTANMGGGFYLWNSDNTLTNNTLIGNLAFTGGGGIYTQQGTSTLTNNTLSGNVANNSGGGIFIQQGTITLTNNTLSGNRANNLGGGIYNLSANTTITNSIIWGNIDFSGNASEIFNSGNLPTVSNSIIRGGLFGATDIDPLFVTPIPAAPTTTGDLRLQLGSPAIDAGDNTAFQDATGTPPGNAIDLDGNARLMGSAIDMGAYEYVVVCPPASILYVDASATGNNNGSSWVDAFSDLQSALESNCTGVTQIWVAAGTYKPSAYPENCTGCSSDRDFTFQLRDGISLYGGFAGNETQLSERDIVANPSILSGDIGTVGDNSDNVYHVVLAAFSNDTPTTRLDGFSITAGNANVNEAILLNGANVFRRNGGGITTLFGTNTMINNTLSGNSATFGGGIFISSGINNLTNNTLSGNLADNSGGGVYTQFGNNTLTNNTLSGNSATNGGGGIFKSGGTHVLTNNIIWGNTNGSGSISEISSSFATITVSNSIIRGGLFGATDIDPLFVTPITVAAPTTTGDLRLQLGSPAIDAGDNTAFQDATGTPPGNATDLDGNARLVGSTIDLGPYENQIVCPPASILYVDASATGNNNGSSWVDAFSDLQSALGSNCTGITQIWVAEGTYYPDEGLGQTNNNRNATFQLKNNVALYGGFNGTETTLAQRNWETNLTILSGDINQSGNLTDNSYTVVTGSGTNATAVLDGFTITKGNADVTSGFFLGANRSGGGIYSQSGSPTLTNCTFSGNTASNGGGISNYSNSSPTITNSIFSGNTAMGDGGGMINGVFCSPTLANCIFIGNTATLGGGMNNGGSSLPTITNTTFSGNTAMVDGGGMANTVNSSPTVTNSIIWNNTAGASTTSNSASVFNVNSAPVFSYSLIANSGGSSSWAAAIGTDGGNNIAITPLFTDALNGDFSLQPGSPAVNGGDNTAYQTATGNDPAGDTDLAGNPRLFQGTIDMGAYEADFNQTQWGGTVSEDWNNSLNWDKGVPDVATAALVVDMSVNSPRILSSTSGIASHLVMMPTAELHVNGILKVEVGLRNDGVVFFNSDATSTGQFDVFTGSQSGSGEVRVERYIPQSNRAFRYISSSVTTTNSINANLQEGATTADANPNPNPGYGTHITGGVTANGFDATGTNNPSMFEWNESGQAWVAVTNTNVKNLQVGEAYALMIRGDRSTDLTDNNADVSPTTLRFAGNLHTGEYPVPSTDISSIVNEWSLVANPYQALLNAKALLQGSDANGLDENYIYIYDPTLGTRGGYATVDISQDNPTSTPFDSGIGGTTNADENVLPNQAFFVKTIAANPSLVIKESYKNVSANFATTFSEGNPLTELHINLKRQPENRLVDGVTLRFDAAYSNAVTIADADKFWNFDERLAIVNENQYLSIEKRALPEDGAEIQLYCANYITNHYEWQIDMNNLQREAVLYDSYLNTETPLLLNMLNSIAFSVDETIPESVNPLRFSIRFTEETLRVANQVNSKLTVYPNPVTQNQFMINGLQPNESANFQLFDMLGKLVYQRKINTEVETSVEMDAVLPVGVYHLKIEQNDSIQQVKLIINK